MNLSNVLTSPDQPNRKLSPGFRLWHSLFFKNHNLELICEPETSIDTPCFSWQALNEISYFLLRKHYNWVAWSLDILFLIKFILIFTASWSSGNLKMLGISFFASYHYLLHLFTTATKTRFSSNIFHEMTYIIFPSLHSKIEVLW